MPSGSFAVARPGDTCPGMTTTKSVTQWRPAAQTGQTLVEYGLLIGAVALVIIALLVFNEPVSNVVARAADCLQGNCFDGDPRHCKDEHGDDDEQVPCDGRSPAGPPPVILVSSPGSLAASAGSALGLDFTWTPASLRT